MGSRLSVVTVVGLWASTTTAFAQPQPSPAPPAPEAPPLAPPPPEEPIPEASPVAGPIAEPMATPAPPSPPAEPIVVNRVSNADLGMVLGAGVGLGLGVGLFVAAHGDARDADDAVTVADHDRLSSRSTTLYVVSAISLGAGVALGAVGLYRINAAKEHNATVSFAPHKGGGGFVLEGSW